MIPLFKYEKDVFGVIGQPLKTGDPVNFMWASKPITGFIVKVFESREAKNQKLFWSKIKIKLNGK